MDGEPCRPSALIPANAAAPNAFRYIIPSEIRRPDVVLVHTLAHYTLAFQTRARLLIHFRTHTHTNTHTQTYATSSRPFTLALSQPAYVLNVSKRMPRKHE